MKIVGIETSSVHGGVAILETKDGSIVLSKELSLKRGLLHGKLLIPALEKLLAKSRWQPEDIDIVAVDIGPGSYTGLRVGLAIAKTIAHIIKSKIVGVPSLEVLVANIPNNYEYACPVIDARWNQVYTAIYKKEKSNNILKYKRISDYLAISPQDLVKLLKRYTNPVRNEHNLVTKIMRYDNNRKIVSGVSNGASKAPASLSLKRGEDDRLLLFGDGIKAYKELFDGLSKRIILGSADLWFPKARNVALLGYESFKQGRHDDPIKLVPLYLRPTEAEINLKRRRVK